MQESVTEMRGEVATMQAAVAQMEGEHLRKAMASLELKQSYYEQSRQIEEAEYAKVTSILSLSPRMYREWLSVRSGYRSW